MSTTGIIVGALAGLMITVIGTMLWPKNKLRWARPLVPPVLGVGIAYLIMVSV